MSVLDGRLGVTFVYPTGGQQAIDWAHNILEGGVNPPLDIVKETTGSERLLGYRRGLARAGLSSSPDLIRTGDFREGSGYEAVRSLLELPQRPDAVFVANHLMTVGALQAIDEAGLAVPHDVAIVGFDDTPWAPLMRPSLTTVAQPTYDVGAEAARLLLGRIDGYRGAVREVLLQSTLRIRASSVAGSTGPDR